MKADYILACGKEIHKELAISCCHTSKNFQMLIIDKLEDTKFEINEPQKIKIRTYISLSVNIPNKWSKDGEQSYFVINFVINRRP